MGACGIMGSTDEVEKKLAGSIEGDEIEILESGDVIALPTAGSSNDNGTIGTRQKKIRER